MRSEQQAFVVGLVVATLVLVGVIVAIQWYESPTVTESPQPSGGPPPAPAATVPTGPIQVTWTREADFLSPARRGIPTQTALGPANLDPGSPERMVLSLKIKNVGNAPI